METRKAIIKIFGIVCLVNLALILYFNRWILNARILSYLREPPCAIAFVDMILYIGFGVLVIANGKFQINQRISTSLKMVAGLASLTVFTLALLQLISNLFFMPYSWQYGYGYNLVTTYTLLNIVLPLGIALYMFKKPLGNFARKCWRLDL